VPNLIEEGIGKEDAVALQTIVGVAAALGVVVFGLIVLSRNRQCLISRQYLLQTAVGGLGETD